MGPFKPDKNQSIIMKPQIPDLNQLAPGNYEEEPWELHVRPSVIIQVIPSNLYAIAMNLLLTSNLTLLLLNDCFVCCCPLSLAKYTVIPLRLQFFLFGPMFFSVVVLCCLN